ncbi:MAG: TetR/AcrR family transcriptional regulator [Gemmatimonadaceae bacterium]|nr:TetR/AcrR family transcriptional regulator [Gemmatimonadaceae bacterium]MCC6432593.1 TetR/AcrR family transcriptional regulator [Gemmatimonadaceae bacterium]
MPLKRASRTRLTKAAVSGESASPVPEVELASTASDADTDDAYRRRPRQSRGQKRVELLLDSAAAVIAESGLQAATAEAIALRARTAKGSLYQFFPNRDAVLAALALRYADEMRAIHERAFPIDPHGLALERLIDRIVRPLAEFHDRNPAFRRVFATIEGPADDTRSAPARLRSQLFDSFVDRLDVLFAARNPKLPSRDRRRAALVSASVGQSILAPRSRAAAADKKALLDDLRRLLVAYLSPLLDPPKAVKSPTKAPTKAPTKTATVAAKRAR